MATSDGRFNELRDRTDDKLLYLLGAEGYMTACAAIQQLLALVEPMEQAKAHEAIATYVSLVTLKYAGSRRHG